MVEKCRRSNNNHPKPKNTSKWLYFFCSKQLDVQVQQYHTFFGTNMCIYIYTYPLWTMTFFFPLGGICEFLGGHKKHLHFASILDFPHLPTPKSAPFKASSRNRSPSLSVASWKVETIRRSKKWGPTKQGLLLCKKTCIYIYSYTVYVLYNTYIMRDKTQQTINMLVYFSVVYSSSSITCVYMYNHISVMYHNMIYACQSDILKLVLISS